MTILSVIYSHVHTDYMYIVLVPIQLNQDQWYKKHSMRMSPNYPHSLY